MASVAVLLCAAYLVLITPVRVGAVLSAPPLKIAVGMTVWGAHVPGRLTVRWTAGGLLLSAGGRDIPLKTRLGGDALGRAALKSSMGRRLLRRLLEGGALTGALQIGGTDAAQVALWTGAARAALSLLPGRGVRCFPSFGGPTALRLRCIAETRLGMLLAAGLLLALSGRTGRKEETPWIIPSGS